MAGQPIYRGQQNRAANETKINQILRVNCRKTVTNYVWVVLLEREFQATQCVDDSYCYKKVALLETARPELLVSTSVTHSFSQFT